MYRVWFDDDESETFGCIACGQAFVSKRAIGRHFVRHPSHRDVAITGTEIAGRRTESGDDGVRRGVARRRLLERLARDTGESAVNGSATEGANRSWDADPSAEDTESNDERS